MRGRKPKPTHLKIVTGNPGGRPLNTSEPPAPPEIPDPPPHLSAEARAEWERMAPLLKDAGLISRLDGQAFATLCQMWARMIDAERLLAEHGMLVRSPNGYPMPSPYLSIANAASKRLVTLLAEFGMTPSARSRIKLDDSDKQDEFEAYLNGSGKKRS